jgi:hypothetical protein
MFFGGSLRLGQRPERSEAHVLAARLMVEMVAIDTTERPVDDVVTGMAA